jgi:hypothetical protein
MGCNGPIFSLPLILEPIATNGWVTHTWKFLQEYQIVIKDDLPDFIPLRHNDSLLIPLFVKNGFSGQELRFLHQCRLYLQVSWLSELTIGDGTKLETNSVKHPYQISCRRSVSYPNQGPPPNDAWKTWTRALSDLCLPNTLILKHKLGPWVSRSSGMWWFDQSMQRLYRQGEDAIREFCLTRPMRTRSSTTSFSLIGVVDCIPPSVPATAREVTEKEVVMTGIGYLQETNHTDDKLSWIKKALSLPENLQGSLNISQSIIAVSDGSFKENHGTAAWIVRITDTCEITGKMVTPGETHDQSAYRSELAGLYGVACTIWLLEQEYGAIGKITAACDGLSALRQVKKPFDFIDPNLPQFDLILATRNVIRKTSWEWS